MFKWLWNVWQSEVFGDIPPKFTYVHVVDDFTKTYQDTCAAATTRLQHMALALPKATQGAKANFTDIGIWQKSGKKLAKPRNYHQTKFSLPEFFAIFFNFLKDSLNYFDFGENPDSTAESDSFIGEPRCPRRVSRIDWVTTPLGLLQVKWPVVCHTPRIVKICISVWSSGWCLIDLPWR